MLTALTVVGQTRVFPSGNANAARRNHIATIHSADSTEGSRVSIVSDQSLNDYEAYRRGDRFYVKIPATDMPRAQAMRGRGFTDVTAQRSGDYTLLSFRLIPGATAHVEQHGNRLEIVIAVVGGGQVTASNRSGGFVWSDTSGRPRAGGTGNNAVAPGARTGNAAGINANKRGNQSSVGNRNSSARESAANASANTISKSKNSNSNSANKAGSTNSSVAGNNSANTNSATGSNLLGSASSPSGSLNSSATPLMSPASGANRSSTPQQSSSPGNSGTQTSNSGLTNSRSDFWTRAKERGHYWLLLAQLNPIPVAIGAAILILIIALFFVQRRRARATRRVKRISKSKATETAQSKAVESAVPFETAAVVAAAPAAKTSEEMTEATRVASASADVAASSNGKPERMNRAAAEANKIFSGQPYDESLVGSADRETRRMVGAELLSAMVGRNIERRDRARAAFMKHGYFDDATRDLRVAASDNERAAAARRLSFTQDPEATPHLVGALNDPSPDVRRAAVEALTDLRDPAAIAPLNGLLQTERDRKVPRHLIEQAIDACATNSQPSSAAPPVAPPPAIATDREVIEI
ncbi:MAG TPA: HEAT repeat domain-containing protein [Pyrinomonadaceae bacterium]|nr:HEAT repeat domain-containing protein [Pyrinomonadaceae bacterium]